MFGRTSKTFFLALIALSFLVPIALMFWNIQYGAVTMVLGLAIAWRALRLVRMIQMQGTLQDQQALQVKRNQAQTIFVQLIDENGNDLAPEIAEAKLAAAHLQAGPRDMVIGVRRKVP